MSQTYIFDIDHTLYPYSPKVEAWMCGAIDEFLINERGLNLDEAAKLRTRYYDFFGTTLAGLLFYDEIQAADYIAYKDKMPMSILDRDDGGLAKIAQSDARMIAITNSHHNHGKRVLAHLGLADKFEKLYGIEDMGFWGKPFRKSFDMVFKDAKIEPNSAVFFEDSPRNLAYPKRLGMTTILINDHFVKKGDAPSYVDYHVANLNEAMEIAIAL